MKQVTIYTDGACSGNPGQGGWAAVLIYGDKRMELCGYEAQTTNNRMEVYAAIQALAQLKESCEVDLYSDSSYLVNAFEQGWLLSWKQNRWRTAAKKPVQNQDLWQQLDALTIKHRVRFHKVKGHGDDELNNRCDFLATNAIRERRASESDKSSSRT